MQKFLCSGPTRIVGLALLAVLVAEAPGLAHHVMDLTVLEPTIFNGLLSGLAHPVLGPDHLVFLVALSLVGLRHQSRWMLGLLAVGLLGSAIGLIWPGLPGAEPLVSFTLVLEALVLFGRLPLTVLLPAMAIHGYVLSASVVGWTAMPLGSYFGGLFVSQGLLLLGSLTLLTRLTTTLRPQLQTAFGMVVLGLGAFWSTSQLIALVG